MDATQFAEFLKTQQTMMQQQQQMLEAFSKMVVVTKPAEDAASSNEKLMESLANSIETFHYDATTGYTFEAWYRRYADLFAEDAKGLDDFAKTRLLLRKLDTLSHDKFINILLPKSPKEYTFEKVVEMLTNTFGKQETLFNLRFQCLQMSKSDNVDFVTHAANVNRRCEDFKINKITSEQFKCLIFVSSLKSARDSEIRTRLLTKLDSDKADDPMTLDKLTAETRRVLNLKHDTAMIGETSTSRSTPIINAVKKTQAKSQPKSQVGSQKSASTPPAPCWLCGEMHFSRDCGFKTHTCAKCHTVGHKEGYCEAAKRISKKGGKRHKKPETKMVQINKVNTGKFRKYIDVLINGKKTKLQLDTASDLTIISKDTWEQLGSPTSGSEVNMPLEGVRSASTDMVPIIAQFECNMEISSIGDVKRGMCYVTSIKDLDVLGIDWIEKFKIWEHPISSICAVVREKPEIKIADLKHEFSAVFNDKPGTCVKTKAHIHINPNSKPVYRPRRPVPFAALQAVEDELNRLEELKIITPVQFSEWSAPIVVVKKPNGKVRICADYSTGLNACVEPNKYPVPDPEEMFTRISGSKIFSKIDLSDAYLQVEVDEESKRLMTINTHRGLYTFNRLAPGIKSAPGIFQQIIDAMVAGLNGVIAYFDDILIFSQDEETHIESLKLLFKRLEDFGFTIKDEKVHLMQPEIKYLGYIVNDQGITTDPEKISAITQMPAPKNVSELRSFLGAINYHGKFVKNLHDLREPFDRLLRTNVEWEWTDRCEKAFQKVKSILLSNLLLTHFNPSLPIIVSADASSTGIGATIAHRYENGTEKAVAYASHSLSETERRYSQIEKEGLALVYAVKKFHRYLLGRRFTLVTDHKPLLNIFSPKNGIPVHTANRLQRWALTLATYDFKIQYTSTTEFGNADVLSRLIESSRQEEEEFVIACIRTNDDSENMEENINVLPITREMIKSASKQDHILQQVIKCIQNGWPDPLKHKYHPEVQKFYQRREALTCIDDCVTFGERIVIPFKFRKLILRTLHKSHLGTTAMKMLARSFVYWPNIDDDIVDTARTCSRCAENAKLPVKTLLQSWPQALRPMERIHTDIAGPIEGKWYLISVDSFSMYPDVHECDNITSFTCIEKLSNFFAHFGNPETLVTDNGTQFTSIEFENFCKSRGIKHMKTPPYHPMSNGRVERFVDTLKRALKKSKGEGGNKEIMTRFLHVYRSTPNRRNKDSLSPAELFINKKIRCELDLLRKQPKVSTQRSRKQEEQFNRHHGARRREFQAGDLVYARTHNNNSNKSEWTEGKIIERRGHVTYNVLLLNRYRVIQCSANQLRPRYVDKEEKEEALLPFQQLIETEPHHSPSIAEDENTSTGESLGDQNIQQSSSETEQPATQRSRRDRRVPTYLKDYQYQLRLISKGGDVGNTVKDSC